MHLNEAGKEISAANAGAFKGAIQTILRSLRPLMDKIGMPTSEAFTDDEEAPISESDRKLKEARNVGEWMEASIHRDFTNTADSMFGDGRLTRDERIALSSAIGNALDAFHSQLEVAAPGLYLRDPYAHLDSPTVMAEADQQDIDTDELISLQEGAVGSDGTALIKLIQPGWGSSGYYPASVLERDGPKVYKAGAKMFWNHPTTREEAERPEGSLDSLASELIEDARYLTAGPLGAGLYAKVKAFDAYRDAIDNLAPHIGVSIRARGKARQGEAEGRKGPIIEAIVNAQSVDYVTTPGAGGEIVALFEAARQSVPLQEIDMSEETKQLQESVRMLQEQNVTMQRTIRMQEAATYRNMKIEGRNLPAPVAARVKQLLVSATPLVEATGAIDTAALDTLVEATITNELAYVQLLHPTGRIQGLGGNGDANGPTLQQLQESNASLFEQMGMNADTAKVAANRQ